MNVIASKPEKSLCRKSCEAQRNNKSSTLINILIHPYGPNMNKPKPQVISCISGRFLVLLCVLVPVNLSSMAKQYCVCVFLSLAKDTNLNAPEEHKFFHI